MRRVSAIEKHTATVDVPHIGDVSLWDSKLTIVQTFYNDFERLKFQRENWETYPDKLRRAINFIFVDDCSDPPLHEEFERLPVDLNMVIYRATEDLKWNTQGAWNLGITKAPTSWVLNMPSDSAIQVDDLTKLMDMKPHKKFFYKLYRTRITNDKSVRLRRFEPHAEVLILNKESFKDVGCFDEDFVGERSGGYGIFDNYLMDTLVRCGYKLAIINDVRMIEWMEDIVGLNIQQKSGVEADMVKLNKQLRRAKNQAWSEDMNQKPDIQLPIIRFEWEKVYEHDLR